MSYVLDVGAVLGTGKTGLPIGYRLIDLNGATVTSFSTTNVIETSIAGNYHVTGGISVPDNFQGRIVFGISGSDYAEVWVNPSEVEANYQADAVLKRGVSHGEDNAELNSLTEIILAALKSSVASGIWNIRKTSGGTFNTHSVVVTPAADPITGVN